MRKAMESLQELSRDEELYQEVLTKEMTEVIHHLDKRGWVDEGMEKGLRKGRKEGIEKGMMKVREQIALNMLKEKTDIAFISKVTGLLETEIIKLKNTK